MQEDDAHMNTLGYRRGTALWSIECEVSRFMGHVRENYADGASDVAWLRVKLAEWDRELSSLSTMVE